MAEFAKTALGGQSQSLLQKKVAREGGNTLNMVSRPFATRSAFRGHGQLGLDIFFHLEIHRVSSRCQLA